MGWTKGQFVTKGFEEIGYANYKFDLAPEQEQSALVRLDSMMAEWDANGLHLGYPVPSTQEGSTLAEVTSVGSWANRAVYLNLSLEIAGMLGKEVKPALQQSARSAYDSVMSKLTTAPSRQWPSHLPAGAGNRTWQGSRGPFLDPPTDILNVGDDSELEFE
jgi:hypothetical protein